MSEETKTPAIPDLKPSPKAELSKEIKLPSPVLGLDVSIDAKKAWAACLDGTVHEVDLSSGERVLLGKHDSYASSVHKMPNNEIVVSGGYDGVLNWHDLKEKKIIRRVQAHQFWSWQTAVSPDGQRVASVTGRYECGGYKYEPAPEKEPSVKVFNGSTGELLHSFPHIPPVQAVTFSPDSRHVAAGNLMGEVRVWDLTSGAMVATFTTPSFTGWGIIKGHYYTGGIYAMQFTPDGEELIVAGMGSTTDPAAGNGRQLWQRFSWRKSARSAEAKEDEIGRGLMEALSFHPGGHQFAMAGRLFNGKWNTALFDATSGGIVHSFDAKMRVTRVHYRESGARLILGGTTDQGKKKDGVVPESGRIKLYSLV
jgi:WD40 repeat protein